MLYANILKKSYTLAISNPVFWLFGFVMLGGFNLYLINFFTLVPNGEWKLWPESFGAMFHSSLLGLLAAVLGAATIFVILNLIKIIFIVTVHKFLHASSDQNSDKPAECNLCTLIKRQTESKEPLPYFVWLTRVMIASALTIALTSGVTLAANAVLGARDYDSPIAVIINLLIIAAITCIIGTWNIFTSYFIVLHGMNFQSASSAGIDLMTKHARRVAEFVVLLSVIYTLAVIVGNAFIHVWRFDVIVDSFALLRLLFMVISVLWFAVNNAFFNIAFLVFFDRTVKSTPATQETPAVTPAS